MLETGVLLDWLCGGLTSTRRLHQLGINVGLTSGLHIKQFNGRLYSPNRNKRFELILHQHPAIC
ncbi:MAG: hypothetical protein H6R01_1909 [Burkholderiaceae bacterium]|nr:hypothetical protein [Burkholderiaceae bacterium]